MERKEVSEKISAVLDRWHLENEGDPDYDGTLQEFFKTDLAERNPSQECLEALARTKERLGIKVPAKKEPLHRKTYFRLVSAAAVVLITLGVSLGILLNSRPEIQPVPEITIASIEGVQKDVVLSDDSKVWINSGTTLTYAEEFGKERNVKLEGQARFDVTKDTERPFQVKTERLSIRVLGTDFQVREYPAEDYTEVILYEGSVEVNTGAGVTKLTPGEKLTYHPLTGEVNIEVIEIDMIDDWRSDRIVIEQKTMPELLAMIANYYDTDIIITPEVGEDTQLYMFGFGKEDPLKKVMDTAVEISGYRFRYEMNEEERVITIMR
jgi:Fe2+-dicitrate sensor, membrane component